MDELEGYSSTREDVSELLTVIETSCLSVDEKSSLGQRLIAGSMTTAEALLECNFTSRTLNRYMKSVRDGLALHEESGRPRVLDTEGFHDVVNHMRRHPGCTGQEINILSSWNVKTRTEEDTDWT